MKETKYRLNPILSIPSIIRDCLDDYATIDQAVREIRKILEHAKEVNPPHLEGE